MKIAYPAAGTESEKMLMLSNDFVVSKAVGVFNTLTGTSEVYERSVIEKALVDWLIEEDIKVILTPELQVMALKVFRNMAIEVFKAENNDLNKNLALLKKGKLSAFSAINLMEESIPSCSSGSCDSCQSSSCGS